MKLQPPVSHVATVARPELLDLLASTPAGGVAGIFAPTGYGKTTLLSDLHRTISTRTAWLTVDGFDSDPARFWRHLLTACNDAAPGRFELRDWDRSDLRFIDEVVVPSFLNAMNGLDRPLLVLLDDVSLIEHTSPVWDQLSYVIDLLPGSARLVIAGRVEPDLGLARSTAGGRLIRVGTRQLAFGAGQVAAVITAESGVEPDPDEVATTLASTEGWPAGVQLAVSARSAAPRPVDAKPGPRPSQSASLGAATVHMTDEVLRYCDGATVTMLERLSVLDHFCPDIAAEVTGIPDSHARLARLVKRNAFIEPTDSTGNLRMHPLLRAGLIRRLAPRGSSLTKRLHERAFEALLSRGRIVDAASHGVALTESRPIRQLLAAHWYQLLASGEHEVVRRGLGRLSPTELAGDPALLSARSRLQLRDGDNRGAAATLTTLARGCSDEEHLLLAEIGDAELRLRRGLVAEVAAEAGSLVSRSGQLAATSVTAMLLAAQAALWNHELDRARDHLESLLTTVPECHLVPLVTAQAHLAVVLAEQHHPERAERTARSGLERGATTAKAPSPAISLLRAALALSLRRSGHLAQSVDEARRAAVGPTGADPLGSTYALLVAAGVARAAGSQEVGRVHVAAARERTEGLADIGLLLEQVWRRESRSMRRLQYVADPMVVPLTDREHQQLRLLPMDLTQREIAAELSISYNTVKTNSRSIYQKLGARSRAEAVAAARNLRLI